MGGAVEKVNSNVKEDFYNNFQLKILKNLTERVLMLSF